MLDAIIRNSDRIWAGIELFEAVNDLLGGAGYAAETPNIAVIPDDSISYFAEEKAQMNQESDLRSLLEKNGASVAEKILTEIGQMSMGIGESEAGEFAYESSCSKDNDRTEIGNSVSHANTKHMDAI